MSEREHWSNLAILALAVFPALTGCELLTAIDESQPTISQVSGPGLLGTFSDLDGKPVTITIDVSAYPDLEVLFVYGNSPDALDSVDERISIDPNCSPLGGSLVACQAQFPNPVLTGAPVFAVGDTIFWRWLIGYGSASVLESNIFRFNIINPISCPFEEVGLGQAGDTCELGFVCLQFSVALLGTPGLESVPRCAIETFEMLRPFQ